MVCIYCGSKTSVINSRSQKRLNQIWRRRACHSCKAIFTTHEMADLAASLMVRCDKTVLRPFSRDKLLLSIYTSCSHRKNALDDATALAGTVIQLLLPLAINGSLEKYSITASVQAVLERFDHAAAVFYEAHHTAG